jgi:hypothetical protein
MGMFGKKGGKSAPPIDRLPQINGGFEYELEVLVLKEHRGQQDDLPYAISNFKVLKSNDPELPPGSECSTQPLCMDQSNPQAYGTKEGLQKKMVAALMRKPGGSEAWQNVTADELNHAFSADNPCMGLRVRVRTKTGKKNPKYEKPLVNYDWFPV